MKRTIYRVQCLTPDGTLTAFDRYAWNSARESIVATLRATGRAWERGECNYLKTGNQHYHGSEVWHSEGGSLRFTINKLDADGVPVVLNMERNA